jgi:uncharacterized membrane protein (DUF106 family)
LNPGGRTTSAELTAVILAYPVTLFAPMLLNEVRQQQSKIAAQSEEMRTMQERLKELEGLNRATVAALRKLQEKDEFVAQQQ